MYEKQSINTGELRNWINMTMTLNSGFGRMKYSPPKTNSFFRLKNDGKGRSFPFEMLPFFGDMFFGGVLCRRMDKLLLMVQKSC